MADPKAKKLVACARVSYRWECAEMAEADKNTTIAPLVLGQERLRQNEKKKWRETVTPAERKKWMASVSLLVVIVLLTTSYLPKTAWLRSKQGLPNRIAWVSDYTNMAIATAFGAEQLDEVIGAVVRQYEAGCFKNRQARWQLSIEEYQNYEKLEENIALEECRAAYRAMACIAALDDPSRASVKPLIDQLEDGEITIGEFLSAIEPELQLTMEAELERMGLDATPNWAYIGGLLALDEAELSYAQIAALSVLFVEIGAETEGGGADDIREFLNCCYRAEQGTGMGQLLQKHTVYRLASGAQRVLRIIEICSISLMGRVVWQENAIQTWELVRDDLRFMFLRVRMAQIVRAELETTRINDSEGNLCPIASLLLINDGINGDDSKITLRIWDGRGALFRDSREWEISVEATIDPGDISMLFMMTDAVRIKEAYSNREQAILIDEYRLFSDYITGVVEFGGFTASSTVGKRIIFHAAYFDGYEALLLHYGKQYAIQPDYDLTTDQLHIIMLNHREEYNKGEGGPRVWHALDPAVCGYSEEEQIEIQKLFHLAWRSGAPINSEQKYSVRYQIYPELLEITRRMYFPHWVGRYIEEGDRVDMLPFELQREVAEALLIHQVEIEAEYARLCEISASLGSDASGKIIAVAAHALQKFETLRYNT